MSNLNGTKTEKNLMEAFAGESQARNKYTYFASKAKKEGYEQISAFFTETAGNEKEHAELWFKLLCGGEIPTTADNLKAAAEGENGEWTDMYKRMAKEAREEGFDQIAFLFDSVAPSTKPSAAAKSSSRTTKSTTGKKKKPCGSAATADTLSTVKTPRKSALSALIRKHISNSESSITKRNQFWRQQNR